MLYQSGHAGWTYFHHKGSTWNLFSEPVQNMFKACFNMLGLWSFWGGPKLYTENFVLFRTEAWHNRQLLGSRPNYKQVLNFFKEQSQLFLIFNYFRFYLKSWICSSNCGSMVQTWTLPAILHLRYVGLSNHNVWLLLLCPFAVPVKARNSGHDP